MKFQTRVIGFVGCEDVVLICVARLCDATLDLIVFSRIADRCCYFR